MRVLFVTSEVAGIYKLGGLGDVSYALPVALAKLGIKVTVALPFYQDIKILTRCIGKLSVDFGGIREIVFLFTTILPNSKVTILLFRHPILMTYKGSQIIKTFAFYDKAVASYILNDGHYDIIHCHDWHTGLVPLLLGENNKLTKSPETVQSSRHKTVVTIHNLLYQGKASEKIIRALSISPKSVSLKTENGTRRFHFLEEGITYADSVTTVSPTYAREITTPEYGEGLDKLLSARGVAGILNGIDETIWNPQTDAVLPKKFTIRTVASGKATAKALVRQRLHLANPAVPLLGFIGRLDPTQKGIDIVLEALPHVLPWHDFQLVLLGTGNDRIEHRLTSLVKRFNHAVRFVDRFDEELARQLYAGCDMIVVPSRFEPCGLIQLLAMRYGAIPIVHRTGGLIDTVTHGHTGFVFDECTGRSLARAIEASISVWRDEPRIWSKLIKNAMKADFSWKKSALKYKDLFHKLLL